MALSRVLETLVTKITVDRSQSEKALRDDERGVEKWGKRVGGVVAGVVAAVGSVRLGSAIVDLTREQEAATRQLQQGLVSTNNAVGLSLNQLVDAASGLQAVTTIGDETILRAQSKLVTFTKITGNQFIRTTELAADLSERMQIDLQSAAIQLGKALNDPVANLSALSRAGVQFSDDQKALIKSLFETGESAKGQIVILDELERQFGGSARAARDTFGGAITALNNAASDLLEADGKSLPGIKDEIEQLTAVLSDPQTVAAAQKLSSAVVKSLGAIASISAKTINVVQFMGEELAAQVNGPGVGDLIRITDELTKARAKLERLEANPRARNATLRALRNEVKVLEEKLRMTRSIQALSSGNAAASASSTEAPTSSESFTAPTPKLDAFSANLQRQIDLYGETSKAAMLRYDLEAGRIKGLESLTSAQIDGLIAQAQALDELVAKEKIANETKQKLKADLSSLESQLENENLTLDEAHQNRLMMLEDARARELITEQRYANLKLKVDKDLHRQQRQLSAKGFSTLLDIAGRYYDGVSSKQAARARVALTLGKALLDDEKRRALVSIGINTYKTAMAAYGAMAGIPYVGPFLGAAAAGAVVVAGTAYAANVAGIAHGGLANVPEERTYLLAQGERVVSPAQNTDLTSFLSDYSRSNRFAPPENTYRNNIAPMTSKSNVEVIINEAPGVQSEVNVEEVDGVTRVTIEQTVREITRDEIREQQAPGGLLNSGFVA